MKIALGVHQFFPEYFAGTEVLTLKSALELQKRGHEVIIYTGFYNRQELYLDEENAWDEYQYNGLRVKRLISVPVQRRDLTRTPHFDDENSFFAETFVPELAREKFDLVHFFHLYRLGNASLEICRRAGVPAIVSLTDFWATCPLGQLVLPDGTICGGPDPVPTNCLKHCLQARCGHKFESALGSLTDEDYARFFNKAKNSNVEKSLVKIHDPEIRTDIFPLSEKLGPRLSRMVARLALADRVIVPSKVIGRVLDEHNFSSSNRTYIPFGLDLDGLIERCDRGTSEKLTIGFIGSIIPTKGIHVLLKAIQQLRDYQNLRVRIYGRTSEDLGYFEKLQAISEGDDRVSFTGTFESTKIWEVLSSLDCLIIPSTWYENTPLVLLSAQAAKCPVIATNLDGMSEVITHEYNGLLFESENHLELADCISKIYNQRELLPTFARNAVPQRSMPQYVDQLELIYSEVLARRPNYVG